MIFVWVVVVFVWCVVVFVLCVVVFVLCVVVFVGCVVLFDWGVVPALTYIQPVDPKKTAKVAKSSPVHLSPVVHVTPEKVDNDDEPEVMRGATTPTTPLASIVSPNVTRTPSSVGSATPLSPFNLTPYEEEFGKEVEHEQKGMKCLRVRLCVYVGFVVLFLLCVLIIV